MEGEGHEEEHRQLEDLYNRAAELAARDHVSVEEFVSGVLADRLASREYIEPRARLFIKEEFE